MCKSGNRIAVLAATVLFFALAVQAEVPNRITYQGRLSKSGVGAAGKHIFVARILNAAGTSLWSSGNIELTLPSTGDFSLVLEPDLTGTDWLTNSVKLEISVDGEKLSPTDSFSSSPYALVAKEAQSVMADGVTTVSIASGAVTNDKLAENLNLSPSKVLMYSGVEGSFTLASWLAAGTTGLIDAAKIKGNLTAQYDEVAGTAVVRHANFQQYIRPTMNVVPLTIASLPEGTTSVFEIRDKNGNMSVKVSEDGYVGVGTDNPAAPLEVNGNAQMGTVVPSVASAYNLGASTNPWANVYTDSITISGFGSLTPWAACSPTVNGFGTVSDGEYICRQIGDTYEINGKFRSGTVSATEASISLPAGKTLDFSVLSTFQNVVGDWTHSRTEAISSYDNHGALTTDGSTTNKIYFSRTGSSGAKLPKENSNSIAKASNYVFIRISVPVQ